MRKQSSSNHGKAESKVRRRENNRQPMRIGGMTYDDGALYVP
ncbi:hypothetical protein SUBVAR_07308 [Subdoligranulum variabile DSM 15176]|uniref:Uncharacterized protein n=1 Tax=Subdoligranulum variabile DSM 15176 TaxID=411471 RepID=D1PSC5_9FIRM|nr:hypothetical protein SUBVAR_07308 [Subdoligranulum variabile DSM 15176]